MNGHAEWMMDRSIGSNVCPPAIQQKANIHIIKSWILTKLLHSNEAISGCATLHLAEEFWLLEVTSICPLAPGMPSHRFRSVLLIKMAWLLILNIHDFQSKHCNWYPCVWVSNFVYIETDFFIWVRFLNLKNLWKPHSKNCVCVSVWSKITSKIWQVTGAVSLSFLTCFKCVPNIHE